MSNVLKSMRLHIGILGKRNVGKSSLLNLLTGQDSSIVSNVAGTTTDVVEKAMELLPIGPVLFFDTAGVDDIGELGKQRVKKTYSFLERMDIALIVCDYNGIDEFEIALIDELKKRKTPFAILVNKNDEQQIPEEKMNLLNEYCSNILSVNTRNSDFIFQVKSLVLKIMPEGFFDDEKILDDLLEAQDVIIHVIPVDKEAPRGRLILPQVGTIRNALDNSVVSIVVRETELEKSLNLLKVSPKLVITDSQAFAQVSKIVPDDVLLTSYSIAFARLKGDLSQFVQGAKKISDLQDGDKILVCESCTHHPICNDIGRVKIPNLLRKFTSKELVFETYSGHDFPENLSEYSLIIHCGGCMTNKKEVLNRILLANEENIAITNYGIAIAYCLGILDRAIKPFSL